MSFIHSLAHRLRALFQKEKLDQRMDDEMRSHIEMQVQENLDAGMEPDDARYAALRQFGWMESIKERCRDQRRTRWIEHLAYDIRYTARMLCKNLGFSSAATLTLALAIGSNALLFSVARVVLFRPLGFDGEDRLMWIRRVNTQTGAKEDRLSWQDMEDIRSLSQSFESVSTFGEPDAIWQDGDRSEVVSALRAPPNLAETLRLRPALGRWFQPSDVVTAGESVVLISHEFWQTRFGGNPDVIGQTLRLDKRPRTIIGVLPAGLRFPLERAPSPDLGTIGKRRQQHFWFPMSEPRGEDRISRNARMFLAVGRLRAGVSEERVQLDLYALGKRLAIEYPESNKNWGFTVISFRDELFGRTRRGIPLLTAAVVAVLLIGCVNLANLLLARGMTRKREFAVRLALGAGSARLVQLLMMESALLALAGGGIGIALAAGALHLTRELAAGTIPFIREAGVDKTVIAFTAGISMLTALACGLLPAMRQSRADAADALGSGSRMTGGPQVRKWQQSLQVGEIALVLVLLMSAGLLLESFRRLLGQDIGYHPGSVIALDLSQDEFDTNGEVCRYYRALRQRLAAIPGVDDVGTISSAPLTGKWTFAERVNVIGRPLSEADRPSVAGSFVAFDYFRAMSIPLIEGRFFREDELNDDGYGQIVILNETAATLLFPGTSAIGGRFTADSNPDRILQVVGVVRDTRDVRLEERPQPRCYWQYAFGGAEVVVRVKAPITAMIPILRNVAQETDKRVRINSVRPMAEILASTVADRYFLMILVTTYTGIALAIASLGVLGIVWYDVAARRSEFGIRLALGATPRGIMRLVLYQTAGLTLLGLAIGHAIAFASNRLLVSQIFGLSPHDPILLVTVSLIVFFTAGLAGWWPARRAASVDPLTALRCE